MIYTLENILEESFKDNPLKISRILKSDSGWERYLVLEEITVMLSNGETITIPKGYRTDISSVPRIFWALLPPIGDFALGAVIHDYLYENKLFDRKFNDNEMFKWSIALNGTNKWSIRNIDNFTRFFFVRLFGWYVWNK